MTARKPLFDVTMEVKVKFLCDGQQKNLYKSSPNAVGYELFSTECVELLPNEIRKLPTGDIGITRIIVRTSSRKEQC